MRTLAAIIARECRTRLRRPSFWVATLLVPAVLGLLYALPVATARHASSRATVLVVDPTGLFAPSLQSTAEVAFLPSPTLDHARKQMQADRHTAAILYIPTRETTIPRDAYLYHRGSAAPPALRSLVDHQLQVILRNAILEDVYQLPPSVYHSVESTSLKLRTREVASGKESYAGVKNTLSVTLSLLVVIALVLYCTQTMRSVQEERQSRVMEIVATSVKPRTLLAGKMAGVALTALVQMAVWGILTLAAVSLIQQANPELFAQARQQQQALSLATKGAEATAQYAQPVELVDEAVRGLTAINLPLVASAFALCFLLGFMLYGSIAAALASRLDSDADALQWSLIACSPLLASLALSPLLLRAPDGSLAAWLTLLPFTAPATVMQRLPYGLPTGQLLVGGAAVLALSAGLAFLAASVYRRYQLRH